VIDLRQQRLRHGLEMQNVAWQPPRKRIPAIASSSEPQWVNAAHYPTHGAPPTPCGAVSVALRINDYDRACPRVLVSKSEIRQHETGRLSASWRSDGDQIAFHFDADRAACGRIDA